LERFPKQKQLREEIGVRVNLLPSGADVAVR
jgi:hypothetical protein